MERQREIYQDEIDESDLINVDEIGVPVCERLVGRLGVTVVGVAGFGVLLAVLDDLRQDGSGDVGQGNHAVGALVVDQVLDRLRLHRHGLVHFEQLAVGAPQRDLRRRRRHRRIRLLRRDVGEKMREFLWKP